MSAVAAGSPSPADLGARLATVFAGLPLGEQAALLARLERAAAARYRAWAEEVPRFAGVLRDCARSEEEIADRAERLFPMSPAQSAKLDALVPRAREIYYAIFASLGLRDQLATQQAAEGVGAAAWREFAADPALPQATREALAQCAVLEEASAARLGSVLASGVL